MKRHITAFFIITLGMLLTASLSCKKEEPTGPLTLFSFIGNVTLKSGTESRTPAVGEALVTGQTLVTGDMAIADILLEDRGIIRVHQNSAVLIDSIENRGAGETRFDMSDGKIYVTLSKLSKGGLTIKTPTAVASVRGTVFRVSAEKGVARLDVVSGRVAINPVSESEIISEVEQVVEAEETVSVDRETAVRARRAVEKKEKMKLEVRALKADAVEDITSELRNVRPEMIERLKPEARKQIREKLFERRGEGDRAEGRDRAREARQREKADREDLERRLRKERLIPERRTGKDLQDDAGNETARLEKERVEAERKEKAEKARKEKEARERASNIPTL